jgi:hypothetical protein
LRDWITRGDEGQPRPDGLPKKKVDDNSALLRRSVHWVVGEAPG